MTGTPYIDLDSLEPIPGDYIVALNDMRAWESHERRGQNGSYVQKGDQALVLQTYTIGNQRRIVVLRDDQILLMSCAEHAVRKNWKVARPAPRLPTLGCP